MSISAITETAKRHDLRPVIHLPSGKVWPTPRALARDFRCKLHQVLEEIYRDDGLLAYFPEYYANDTGHWRDVHSEVLGHLAAGQSWDVIPPGTWDRSLKLPDHNNPKNNGDGEVSGVKRPGRTRRIVLDFDTGKTYRSVSQAARELGITRANFYKAMARGRLVRGHFLLWGE